jgi:peptidoglycan/LPS O-acetylase OafA/YrhL
LRPVNDPAPVGDATANNFDLLRIGAAVLVLVSHSFALSGHHEPSIRGSHLGTVAVLVFFGVSGFLVTMSWQREPHLWRFLYKRALRVLPALVVVLVVVALVLGPFMTTDPAGSYFSSSQVWRFVTDNTLFWQMRFDLPGVFTDAPYPGANGSLWTLSSEVHAYIALALLGAVGLLGRRAAATLLVVAGVAMTVYRPDIVYHYHVGTAFLFWAFGAGVVFALWRRKIPWRWTLVAGGLAAWLLTPVQPVLIAAVVIPYTSIMLAYRAPGISGWLHNRDVSYGTYLYAWPVQQTVVHASPGISSGGLIAAALPITLMLAALSWVVVERPALTLKNVGRQRAVRLAPA